MAKIQLLNFCRSLYCFTVGSFVAVRVPSALAGCSIHAFAFAAVICGFSFKNFGLYIASTSSIFCDHKRWSKSKQLCSPPSRQFSVGENRMNNWSYSCDDQVVNRYPASSVRRQSYFDCTVFCKMQIWVMPSLLCHGPDCGNVV